MKMKTLLVVSVVGLLIVFYGGNMFATKPSPSEPLISKDLEKLEIQNVIPDINNLVLVPKDLDEASKEETFDEEVISSEFETEYFEEYEEELIADYEIDFVGNIDNIPQGQEQTTEVVNPPVNKPVEESKNDITIIECDPEKGEYRFYDAAGNLIKVEYFEPEYKITP